MDGSGWRRCPNRKRIGCLLSRTCRWKQFLFVTCALDIEVWIPGVNSDILKSESRNARQVLCTNIISDLLKVFIYP